MNMKNGASRENYPATGQAFVETETVELKTPPAISHRNTRCVDRAGKYFLEYAA